MSAGVDVSLYLTAYATWCNIGRGTDEESIAAPSSSRARRPREFLDGWSRRDSGVMGYAGSCRSKKAPKAGGSWLGVQGFE